MGDLPATSPRCSENSLAAGELLYATASRTDIWILVEYPEVIGAKALKDSTIPEPVTSYLAQLQKDNPHTRLLLIKKSNRRLDERLTAFVCFSSGETPRLYKTGFAAYEELLSMDVQGVISGSPNKYFDPVQEKLFLVCTNAMRDRCCGLWGVAVFKKALSHVGDAVWQSSHVGGHRFAANLVCLPHGLYYGRVRPENAGQIIDRYRDNQLDLDHYRGRASYPPEAQAAEYFLRSELSSYDIDAFRLEDIQISSDMIREVYFLSNLDSTRYAVRIRIEISENEIFESCAKPDQFIKPPRYALEGWNKQ